jgi:hypothetical protein
VTERRSLPAFFAALLLVSLGLTTNSCGGGGTPAVSAPVDSLPERLPESSGASYYVSTEGTDSGPGSRNTPWRTIARALESVRPGDTIFLRGGTYAQNLVVSTSGTAARPITLRSSPGEQAVLRPAPTDPSYPVEVMDAAYVRLAGLVVEGAVGVSIANVYVEGGSHDVEISGCTIRKSQEQGIFTDRTTRRVQVVGNSIYENGTTSDPKQNHGIYVEGTDQVIANNVIFSQPHGYGIQVYPKTTGILVANNTVVGNSLGGIVVGGNGETTADRTLVVNNIVAFNGQYGIRGYYAGGPKGSGNVALRNLAFGNPAGDFVNDTQGVIAFSANVTADPLFVDPRAHDYRLRAGSPAIDHGVRRFAPAVDRIGVGRPKGPGVDLGAFERPR